MILGLAVSHLLGGVAGLVQHPNRYKPYWVHLVWTLFLFLYLIHFWWWEFGLHNVVVWTFPLYFFIAIYAVLMYLACSLLYPRDLSDYNGYADYFYSRKAWIFSTLALMFLADIGDTLIKGMPYFRNLGPAYYVRTASYLVLSVIAIRTNSRRFHAAFAVFAAAGEIAVIFLSYLTVH
jgi:hypothetical protein